MCAQIQVISDAFATPWTLGHQAPLSMGFSRQEYWSELPFLPGGNLPELGIASESPALAGGFFTTVEFPVDHHEQPDQPCQPVLTERLHQ